MALVQQRNGIICHLTGICTAVCGDVQIIGHRSVIAEILHGRIRNIRGYSFHIPIIHGNHISQILLLHDSDDGKVHSALVDTEFQIHAQNIICAEKGNGIFFTDHTDFISCIDITLVKIASAYHFPFGNLLLGRSSACNGQIKLAL